MHLLTRQQYQHIVQAVAIALLLTIEILIFTTFIEIVIKQILS